VQATSPWTLLEAGYNFNHTKDLLRLLRDRGALAGAALESLLGLPRARRYDGIGHELQSRHS
jgi:hypothetical protein